MMSEATGDAMKPEDHLEFLAPDEIRIHGTRIGLENVLHRLIDCSYTPEAIVEQFPSLSLEQVHAVMGCCLAYQKSSRGKGDSFISPLSLSSDLAQDVAVTNSP
jgi:uncharacterized protein (DUF433 family)